MTIALAIVFAVALWWGSTVLVLYLDGLKPKTFKYSLAGAGMMTGVSLWELHATAGDDTMTGAIIAFVAGLVAWGAQEMSFYMGLVTGPRKTAPTPGATGRVRFVEAVKTLLWHELAIVALSIVILALTWGQPNRIGLWTFVVLWWMHQSAKLNLFLGVRNTNEEFLPRHLAYLKGYFRKRAMNPLFPVSVTISTVVTVFLARQALASGATSFEQAGYGLLSAMMALAVIEHWLLVLPFPTIALWRPGLASHLASAGGNPAAALVVPPSAAPVPQAPPSQTLDLALDGIWRRTELRPLLDRLALGQFGQVDRLKGLARAPHHWLRFELAGGRISLSVHVPRGDERPRVTIIGQGLAHERLTHAFTAAVAMPRLVAIA